MKSITIAGTTYRSISDAARAYGISHSTICNRVARGMSIEDAITTPYKPVRPLHGYTVFGIEFRSEIGMCRTFGIPPRTFQKRIERGMTLEDALTTPAERGRSVTAFGVTYGSIVDACKAHRIDVVLVRGRLQRGYGIERALSDPPEMKYRGLRVSVNGDDYRSISAAGSAHGVPKDVLYARISAGESLENAATRPPDKGTSRRLHANARRTQIENATIGIIH